MRIKNYNFILAFVFVILWGNLFSQSDKKISKDFCISNAEYQLYERLNQFLTENGNKSLTLSKSLSFVAKTHVNDLQLNHPDTSICNLSSWSDKGNWNPCCYNKYVLDQDCMWDKPKELTNFRYRGYELAIYFEVEFNTDSIMQILLSSNKAIDMLLTKNDYSKKHWVCMGLGINEKYVSIWFAQRADNSGKVLVCKGEENKTEEQMVPLKTKYYIIAGSFNDIKDAREVLKRLKQNEFSDSGILKSGTNNRVYLAEFPSLKEAMYFKQKLPYTYNDAWILKE